MPNCSIGCIIDWQNFEQSKVQNKEFRTNFLLLAIIICTVLSDFAKLGFTKFGYDGLC